MTEPSRPDPDAILQQAGEHLVKSAQASKRKRESAKHMWRLWRDNHFIEGFRAELEGR